MYTISYTRLYLYHNANIIYGYYNYTSTLLY